MALQEEIEQQGNVLFKYRSYLPILLLLVGFVVYGYDRLHQQQGIGNLMLVENVAILVSLLGLLIRVITVGYTPQNTSGRNTKRQVAETLNTEGIYATVRHPLYVGNFFMYLGIAILTNNFYFIIIFILVFWLYYERIMFAEEQFLRRKFGTVYTDWAAKTNAFIPNLQHWKQANLAFSWKKVVKKEKNGLVAVFLVFFLFQIIGNYVEQGSFVLEHNWLTYATLLSGILYLILKFVKKRTNLLDETGR